MHDDAGYLSVAIDTARAAGALLLEHFGRELEVATKSSAIDLVTSADRAAEALILARLHARFPEHGVLAEESGRARQGAWQWIVDPLDGTTNFAHRFPHFSVSIGLFDGQTGLVGVVHDPVRQETFFARRGQGAWLRRPNHDDRRLQVTDTEQLSHSLLATGFGYDRPRGGNVEEFGRVVRQVRGVRRVGSAALDLAYVASGRVDGFWEYCLQPWDWGAGVLLVREAGGEVHTMHGEPWTLRGPSVCASGPRLHAALQQALR